MSTETMSTETITAEDIALLAQLDVYIPNLKRVRLVEDTFLPTPGFRELGEQEKHDVRQLPPGIIVTREAAFGTPMPEVKLGLDGQPLYREAHLENLKPSWVFNIRGKKRQVFVSGDHTLVCYSSRSAPNIYTGNVEPGQYCLVPAGQSTLSYVLQSLPDSPDRDRLLKILANGHEDVRKFLSGKEK